jgi:hypothetical protein
MALRRRVITVQPLFYALRVTPEMAEALLVAADDRLEVHV